MSSIQIFLNPKPNKFGGDIYFFEVTQVTEVTTLIIKDLFCYLWQKVTGNRGNKLSINRRGALNPKTIEEENKTKMDKTKIAENLEKLQAIPAKIAEIFTKYHETLSEIRRQAVVSVDATHSEREEAANARNTAMRNAKEETFEQLKTKREMIDIYGKNLNKQINIGLGLRPDSADTNENLLRESRMTAAWNRIKPILDREEITSIEKKIGELAKSFGAGGDADSIAVLLRELPLYLEIRFAARDAKQMLPIVLDHLYNGLAGQTAEAQEALGYKRELETGMYQLKMAVNYCESAVKNDEASFPMPTFKKGETLIVDTRGAHPATAKNTSKI